MKKLFPIFVAIVDVSICLWQIWTAGNCDSDCQRNRNSRRARAG